MSELRTNRIVPRDGMVAGAAGGIIQLVSITKTDPFNTTSTSYTDVLDYRQQLIFNLLQVKFLY